MKGRDVLNIVDMLHRDKKVDKEIIFEGIEQALVSATRKKYGESEDIVVNIDRETGDIEASHDGEIIEPEELGRIAALTAKQVMIQKIREAERDVIYDEYIDKVGEMITGTVRRFDRGTAIVSLGRTEGILPYRQQVPGETYHVGERIKCLIIDVKKAGQRVKIILSRTHKDILRHLFEQEVPEVQDRVIEIRALAREAGHRTKIAVVSNDSRVDAVGACVGIRGSRIKNIVDELNGEKIDIVRWNDQPDILIQNALKPAEIQDIELHYDQRKALVFCEEDQLSLAIGRKGQNVRIASKLTGWELDIIGGTRADYEHGLLELSESRSEEITEADVAEALDKHLARAELREKAREAHAKRVLDKMDALFSDSPAEEAPWLKDREAQKQKGEAEEGTEGGEEEAEEKAEKTDSEAPDEDAIASAVADAIAPDLPAGAKDAVKGPADEEKAAEEADDEGKAAEEAPEEAAASDTEAPWIKEREAERARRRAEELGDGLVAAGVEEEADEEKEETSEEEQAEEATAAAEDDQD